MLNVTLKQMLALFLAVLMLRPYPMAAASSAAVLGSISSNGAVAVGDLAAPAENTLFAGDLVKTSLGNAVIQYKSGARVLLGMESTAQFTASAVQLQKGQMTFRSTSDQGPVFQASSLRLEPSASGSAANVILNDGKASVSVTEGAVQVVDPTGARLASIQAGEARLFAMASAAAPPAAPPAAPAAAAAPQMGGGNGNVWLLALGVAAVGASLGIAGLVRAGNANDRADEANQKIADKQAQIDALQGQISTLQTTINSLNAQIAALQSSGNAQTSEINGLKSQVADLEGQIADLLAQIATLESQNTSWQAQIDALQSQNAALQAALDQANADLQALRDEISSFNQTSREISSIITQLSDAQAWAALLQNNLNTLQGNINAAAAAGNTALLNSLISQQTGLLSQLSDLQSTIGNLTSQLRNLQLPIISPTRAS